MRVNCFRPAWLLLVGFCLTAGLFGLASVYAKFPGDEAILLAAQGLRTPWMDRLAFGITALGDAAVAVPVLAATFLVLLWARRQPDAWAVLAGAALIGLGNLSKLAVGRPRPDQAISEVAHSGMSFPSGHAVFAVVFGGLLIVLAEEMIGPPALRRGVQAAVVLLALAIGTSRVYLGVHWPSDVVGGYVFAAVALAAVLVGRNKLAGRGPIVLRKRPRNTK